ncbi:hypothetical protein NDU88_002515 [Pleurodeles waltl]|uniref:Uncharacterized protein n=1 Tax=Pleurodeles waltl TaxID=8319 RepID=A0AAV7UA46_PLEWA|nr:hypothetical protein NDU88_002515 [Pleurodeles waltl]
MQGRRHSNHLVAAETPARAASATPKRAATAPRPGRSLPHIRSALRVVLRATNMEVRRLHCRRLTLLIRRPVHKCSTLMRDVSSSLLWHFTGRSAVRGCPWQRAKPHTGSTRDCTATGKASHLQNEAADGAIIVHM